MEFFNMINKVTSIFAENQYYMLRSLHDSDKSDYMRTLIQNSDLPKAFDLEGYADYVWESTPEDNELIFCIIDKSSKSFAGFCNLRNTNTSTPEIGISLLEEYQNNGIGAQILNLIMSKYKETHNIDYFIARVSSNNTHCLHLMKKMGVTPVGEEDNEFIQAVNALIPNDESRKEMLDLYASEDCVIIYHFL